MKKRILIGLLLASLLVVTACAKAAEYEGRVQAKVSTGSVQFKGKLISPRDMTDPDYFPPIYEYRDESKKLTIYVTRTSDGVDMKIVKD